MHQNLKVWLVSSSLAIISLPLSFIGLQSIGDEPATPNSLTHSLLPLQSSSAQALQAKESLAF